jgi:hypothetical protein
MALCGTDNGETGPVSAGAGPEIVSGRVFKPADLDPRARRPGISAFMRIRNGADFLEATIESHIGHFDEIVAVYNQCTDATPDILMRLRQRHGEKLRVVHYTDRVFPPGSAGHIRTPPDSPQSLVNYYNVALGLTRHAIATKLDDDHLGIEDALARTVATVRADRSRRVMHCFSGLNLARRDDGSLGVVAATPISGNGDIGFFPVSEKTRFGYDRRFETFSGAGLRRVFAGFVYWHLKFLKAGAGFDNYELHDNPDSRYHKQRARLSASPIVSVAEVRDALARRGWQAALLSLVSEKARLRRAQISALTAGLPAEDLDTAAARLHRLQEMAKAAS